MKKSYKVHILCVSILVSIMIILQVVSAVSSAPGSEMDPLVSKSYVDQEITKLNSLIANLTEENTKLSNTVNQLKTNGAEPIGDNISAVSPPLYEVIQLSNGQKIIVGESTEVIVRVGRTTAISGIKGDGLADVTGGSNLVTGNEIPTNHLLIIAKDDGRGLRAESDGVYVMVRGTYQIQ